MTQPDPNPPAALPSGAAPPAGTSRRDRRARGARRMRREVERTARLNQLAELGKLAAGLAHELKNPLSTLKLNLQLLEEDLINASGYGFGADKPGAAPGGLGVTAQRSLTRIATLKKEADRLHQTLDDFLRYAGRLELRLETVSLNAVIEELVDFILPRAQESKVRVLTALAPEQPHCRLDVHLFKQALFNLLLNAIEAMSAMGGELLVRTLQAKETAILYVSDTGVGIAAESLAHIFEAYFTTKKGGTGLGLPTTRRIIEEHHGHISVQSDAGRGTSFRVDLPLAQAASNR